VDVWGFCVGPKSFRIFDDGREAFFNALFESIGKARTPAFPIKSYRFLKLNLSVAM